PPPSGRGRTMTDIGLSTRFTFKVDGLSTKTHVARFTSFEAISSLFEVELTLTTDERDIAFSDVIGKPALLTLETEHSAPRYLHGIVGRFQPADEGHKLAVYHATVVPRLWRLRHRRDSRIFQARTVPDILRAVLSGGGVTDVRLALNKSYAPREYCVQYRES